MKNRMAHLIGSSFGLSLETAVAEGGGGTSVATTTTAGGAGESGGRSTGSAGSGGSSGSNAAPAPTKTGFFKDLPRAAPQTTEKKTQTEDKTGQTKTDSGSATKPFQVLADDKKSVLGEFATQSEAEAFLKTYVDPTKTGETKTDASKTGGETKEGSASSDLLPRPLMGRFATLTEAEVAMRRSQDEGVRLSAELKALKEANTKALADREAEVAALKEEIETVRATPAVKELSKEELAALWKENPAEAAEYVQQKYDRDRNVKAAKERAERAALERRENLVKTNEAIERNVDEMKSDPKSFPKFDEMLPRMSEILRRTGGEKSPLRGQVWANELFYKAALGDIYQELLLKGTETQADAAETARKKAESDAAALRAGKGDGGGSGSTTVVDPVKSEDKKWRDAVRASAPKPFLKERA